MSNLINNRRINLIEAKEDFWSVKVEANREIWASLSFRKSQEVLQDLYSILNALDSILGDAADILQAKKERENEAETETETETETPVWSAETPAEYAKRKKSGSPQSSKANE